MLCSASVASSLKYYVLPARSQINAPNGYFSCAYGFNPYGYTSDAVHR
jgi:hypothetical protein